MCISKVLRKIRVEGDGPDASMFAKDLLGLASSTHMKSTHTESKSAVPALGRGRQTDPWGILE